MILVTLGTQDKQFKRLLKAVDKEIENGTIKEKVIVQAGYTKYRSKNMEIFDLIPSDKFEELMDEADIVITHGGVGSILSALKREKVVIAAPRIKKYKEHTNDHQKEIVEEFTKMGYILSLYDFHKLGKVLEKAQTFKPKKFDSNTQHIIQLIKNYIEVDNHTSWWNKYHYIRKHFVFFTLYICIYNYLTSIIHQQFLYQVCFIGLLLISFFSSKYISFRNTQGSFIYQFLLYIIFNFGAFFISFHIISNQYISIILFFILTLIFDKLIIFNFEKNIFYKIKRVFQKDNKN